MRVFVYGTLKKGFGNHGLLENSKFVGAAITHCKYPMWCSGVFPYMADVQGVGKLIFGEVYEVDEKTLNRLDVLEGVPHHYVRRIIPLAIDKVGNDSAFCYFRADGKVPSGIQFLDTWIGRRRF
jgi:gamma-glutamylaminecyclotransferase